MIADLKLNSYSSFIKKFNLSIPINIIILLKKHCIYSHKRVSADLSRKSSRLESYNVGFIQIIVCMTADLSHRIA